MRKSLCAIGTLLLAGCLALPCTAFAEPGSSVLRKLAAADSGDDRLAAFARLVFVDGLALAPNGDLYVADQSDHRIRRRDARTGLISTVAGTGIRGRTAPGRAGTEVQLDFGTLLATNRSGADVVIDSAGETAYLTDWGNDRILALDTTTGIVSLVAQGGRIERPGTLALFEDRLLYVGTRGASEGIVEIDLETGQSRRIAGSFAFGGVNEIAVDGSGILYVFDPFIGVIHRVRAGAVSTLRALAEPEEFGTLTARSGDLFFTDGDRLVQRDLASGAEESIEDSPLLLALAVTDDGVIFAGLGTTVVRADEVGAEFVVGGIDEAFACTDQIGSAKLTSAFAVAAAPDGRVFLGDGLRNNVFAIDERSNSAEQVLSVTDGFLRDLTVDRAGNLYALYENLDVENQSIIRRVDGTSGAVREVAIDDAAYSKLDVSGDGSRLTAVSYAAGLCYLSTPNLQVQRCDGYFEVGTVDETTGLADVALDDSGDFAYLVSRDTGQLFLIDTSNGDFALFAGNGVFDFGVDGARAVESPLDSIAAVDVAPDGSVVFLTTSQLWRVDPRDGRMEYLAFSPELPDDIFAAREELPVDPIPATDFAQFFDSLATTLSVGPEGQIYYSQLFESVFGVYEPIGSSIRLPSATASGAGLGSAVSASGLRLAVGTPDDSGPNGSGSVAIYRRDDCSLVLEDRIRAPAGFQSDGFGSAVSLVGDELLVGTRGLVGAGRPGPTLGAAFYRRRGQRWVLEQAIEPAFPEGDEGFGQAVAFDGTDMLVGAPEANGGDGGAFVFRRDRLDEPWFNSFIITPPAGATNAFGSAVAVDGGRLAFAAVSSANPDQRPGRVELFRVAGEGLDNAGFAVIPEPGFGSALALHGDRVLVGAPTAGRSGAAYLFDILDGSIALRTELTEPSLNRNAGYGTAVSLGDAEIVVGAPAATGEADSSGAIFGYTLRDLDRESSGKGLPSPFRINPGVFQKGLGTGAALAGGRTYGGAPLTGNGRGDAIASRIILNISGVAGLWFDPTLAGEGYNVIVGEAGTVVYYYGFDPAGRRLWLVSENLSTPPEFGETVILDLFEVTDGTFVAPVPSAEAIAPWGNVRMTINSVTDGVFELNGAAGSKTSRSAKLLGVDGEGAFASGLWFDPALEGEGYNVISSVSGTLIYYYGSTAGGERLWLVSDTLGEQPELGESFEIDVLELRDGTFDAPPDPGSNLRRWGVLRGSFDRCGEASFELEGEDGSKFSKAIQLAGTAGIPCEP